MRTHTRTHTQQQQQQQQHERENHDDNERESTCVPVHGLYYSIGVPHRAADRSIRFSIQYLLYLKYLNNITYLRGIIQYYVSKRYRTNSHYISVATGGLPPPLTAAATAAAAAPPRSRFRPLPRVLPWPSPRRRLLDRSDSPSPPAPWQPYRKMIVVPSSRPCRRRHRRRRPAMMPRVAGSRRSASSPTWMVFFS